MSRTEPVEPITSETLTEAQELWGRAYALRECWVGGIDVATMAEQAALAAEYAAKVELGIATHEERMTLACHTICLARDLVDVTRMLHSGATASEQTTDVQLGGLGAAGQSTTQGPEHARPDDDDEREKLGPSVPIPASWLDGPCCRCGADDAELKNVNVGLGAWECAKHQDDDMKAALHAAMRLYEREQGPEADDAE